MRAKSFDTLASLPEGRKAEYLTRLFSKISIEEGRDYGGSYCWIWVRYTNQGGYGRVWLNKERHVSHRAFYQLMIGPIPEGLELDHLCRVRNCCNPEHLEPVTPLENLVRGNTVIAKNVKKTACGVCGGPYKKKGRQRVCSICTVRANHLRKLRYHAKKIVVELPLIISMPTPCPLLL